MKSKTKSNKNQQSSSDKNKPSSFPPSLLLTNKSNNNFNKKTNNNNNDKQNNYRNINVKTLVPSAVFVSSNFLSEKECQAWIQHAEHIIGFEHMNSPQTREYAHRECGRIQVNDWDMAQLLYNRMKPIVDEIEKQVVVSSNSTYRPICCNGNLRIYKYEKNMSFGRHYDGSDSIKRFDGGNTEITVLIYLSSCEGGATRFYLPHNKKGKQNNKNSDDIAFVPQAGAILLHMHGDRCLEHEADPVVNGVKYVLRTDIVYARV